MLIQTRSFTAPKLAQKAAPKQESTTLVEPPPDGYNPSDTSLAPLGLTVGAATVVGGATAFAMSSGGLAARVAGATGLGAAGAVVGGTVGLMMDIGNMSGLNSTNNSTWGAALGAGAGIVGGALLSNSLGPIGTAVVSLGAAAIAGVGTYAVAQEKFA